MKVVAVRGAFDSRFHGCPNSHTKLHLKHGKGKKFLCRQKQDFLSSPSTMASVPNLLKPSSRLFQTSFFHRSRFLAGSHTEKETDSGDHRCSQVDPRQPGFPQRPGRPGLVVVAKQPLGPVPPMPGTQRTKWVACLPEDLRFKRTKTSPKTFLGFSLDALGIRFQALILQ